MVLASVVSPPTPAGVKRCRTSAAVTSPGGGASVPVGTTGAPVVIAAGSPRSSGTTLANLTTAIQGEAFAYAKYMRYADQARRDGNTAVAQLFTNTANAELNEHFASLATLAGLVAADTNANLNDAITGEQHEADVMYPDYARQARSSRESSGRQLVPGNRRRRENPSANLRESADRIVTAPD